jgi:hypothetical protein
VLAALFDSGWQPPAQTTLWTGEQRRLKTIPDLRGVSIL